MMVVTGGGHDGYGYGYDGYDEWDIMGMIRL